MRGRKENKRSNSGRRNKRILRSICTSKRDINQYFTRYVKSFQSMPTLHLAMFWTYDKLCGKQLKITNKTKVTLMTFVGV